MRRVLAMMMACMLALLGCVCEGALAEPMRLLPAELSHASVRAAFAITKPAAVCDAPAQRQLLRPAVLPAMEDAPKLLLQRRPVCKRQGGAARWHGVHVLAFKLPGLAPPTL